jgi:hypothetical protein
MDENSYKKKRTELLNRASEILDDRNLRCDLERARELHNQVIELDKKFKASKKK